MWCLLGVVISYLAKIMNCFVHGDSSSKAKSSSKAEKQNFFQLSIKILGCSFNDETRA